MEADLILPLVVRFTTTTTNDSASQKTATVNTQLHIDRNCTDLIPILHGKINPMWSGGKLPSKTKIDLCQFQKENGNFWMSVKDVQFVLRTVQCALLYADQSNESLNQAITNLFDEVCSHHVLNFTNIYITMHYIMPERCIIFITAIFMLIRKTCKVECFKTKDKVQHKTLIRWLKNFLTSFFSLDTPLSKMNKFQLNLVNVWSLVRTHLEEEFKREILHLDTLKLSDRSDAVMKEFLDVYDRTDALKLVQSFKAR